MNSNDYQTGPCPPGLHYSCQDNPALRSCARENIFVRGHHQQQQQQVYVCPAAAKSVGRPKTVDVEDLARCFEDQNPNYYPVVSNKNHGRVVRRRVNGQENVSPSERTWVNIKEAFFEDQTTTTTCSPPSLGSEFLSNDTNKMADSTITTPAVIDPNDFRTKWRPQTHERYFELNFNWPDPGNGENRSSDIPGIFETFGNSGNEFYPRDYRGRINFCTEEQWLRCPAPQCPGTNAETNYAFDSSLQFRNPLGIGLLPCMDQSSELHFWYGEDIGYLTPAEYLKYEEDSLSNEKRKEKSRDAARSRRSRETNIFTELGKALPVPEEQADHLDKASVMRLAIAYLKVRTVVDAIPEPLAKPEPSPEWDGLFLKALDGFMIVLSSDGDMVYLSENVSEYLGVSQMDLMGQNVYDYSHPCDHDELRECLSTKPSSPSTDIKQTCNLFLRLKCTLTSKGRKVNLKSASYKVIHCTGHMVVTPRDLSTPSTAESEENEEGSEGNDETEDGEKVDKGSGACLVMVGCPVPHPSNIEAPLGRYTFLSKHSLNMKFTYADEKLAEYLGWDTGELVGQSVFEFHHALDNILLDKSFKSLFSKGQCETAPYRFLGKKGGYAWVVTQATLIHCAKQNKPLSVVCVNYIVSGIECENEVYSARQLEARSVDASADDVRLQSSSPGSSVVSVLATVALSNSNKIEKEEIIEPEIPPADLKNGDLLIPLPILERPRPLSVTASLFRNHEKAQREVFASKKVIDPQKDLFQKPISSTDKIFARKNTQAIGGNKKENLNVSQNRNLANNHSASQNQPELIFQGKPVKYFTSEVQRVRPQVVTRSLFAPAPQVQEPPSRPPPQTATASIFAPRTEDMNKGFLTFSEDQPGLTMLKDEPEDLTHLAPTPGDVCVPLEDTPFICDMLDDFILGNDNYCPLLSPGLPNELRTSEIAESLKDSDLEESLRSNDIGESLADSDPFMYRDSPSSCSGSPNLLSPALTKSPGSIDSLCSPTGSGGGLSEDEMLMLSIGDVLADDELALRAPYIPMSDQDETLQLFISNDMVMWPQPPDKKSKWSNVTDNNNESNVSSSLEQLLRNHSGNVKKCNDHGGGLVDPSDALGGIYKKHAKEDCPWQSKSDRSQKRVHCTTVPSFENESKRLKCSDEGDIDDGVNFELDNEKSRTRDSRNSNNTGSQLLQQLMSQQSPSKSRDQNEGRGNGNHRDGNGNCRSEESAPTTQQHLTQQQSNSVLMNLLVSGCDGVIDPRNIPPLLQRKISPLSVNLDHQTVPQISGNILEHLSPDTRNELVNSLPGVNNKLNSPQELEPMDFENFEFDVSPLSFELLQGSDLLKIPGNNIV